MTNIGTASFLFNLITSRIASKSNIEPTAAMMTAANDAVGIHLKSIVSKKVWISQQYLKFSANKRAEIRTATAVIIFPN